MRALSYGQRSWMTTHIAAGLRHLGIDVTPQTMETELEHLNAAPLRAAAGYTPPDPYAAGIAKLKESNR